MRLRAAMRLILHVSYQKIGICSGSKDKVSEEHPVGFWKLEALAAPRYNRFSAFTLNAPSLKELNMSAQHFACFSFAFLWLA